MPELPDLVRVERVLSAAIAGRRVRAARTGDPTVLRIMVTDPFPATLVGRILTRVERRGHFMRFAFEGELVLVVNAMLVGRYRLLGEPEAASEKDPAALGFALAFEDGPELRYIDDKRMGKVYVARPADEGSIAVYGQLGIDLLSEGFDRERFGALARARRDQVRMFLMDKRALASIGNAYADEILFAARLHPKTFVRQLTAEDLDRLFAAIGQVLRHAIHEIQRRDGPIDVKVRDFLSVRGRDGQPCPGCGTKIRSVRVGDGDACFCPHCQPTTRRLFLDWGRLPSADGAAVAAVAATSGTEPAPGLEPGVKAAEPDGASSSASISVPGRVPAGVPGPAGKARRRRPSRH